MNSKCQTGFVLISSLLILVVLTTLAVSMFHGVSAQTTMAGNLKDKGRAFRLAQSTLLYAEYLLASQGPSIPHVNNCGQFQEQTTICNNSAHIQYPTNKRLQMQLQNGTFYTNMKPHLKLSRSGGIGTYYAYPQYQIQYLGPAANAQGQIYAVTALAYGGSPNAVAAVQSTYKLTSGTRNLGSL